jgi:hypothetical protein
MGKVGTWLYWFKTPNGGYDMSYCTNKKDIPKGYDYVQDFTHHKSDGNIDSELIYKGKVVYVEKNINKKTQCERFNSVTPHLAKIHKLLKIDFDMNLQERSMANQLKKWQKKKPELKGCKLK